MNPRHHRAPSHCVFATVIVGLIFFGGWAPSSVSGAETVDYVRDVFPILQTYCIGCHTADDAQGGLVMESHAALLAGGDSGPAITAGVADSSRLFLMASGKLEPVMPPDDMDGPDQAELEILARWIDQGGLGPAGDEPVTPPLRVPEISPAADVALPITAMAASPDGRRRVIARFGNLTLQRVEPSGAVVAESRFALPPERGGAGKINSLRFDATGDRLLIASGLTGAHGLATLATWDDDALQLRVVRQFTGHRDTLYAAEFSPDGKWIATAGYDREIVLWDASTGKVVRKLSGHNGAIFDLAFSPDGGRIASACGDETIKVWDVATGQRLDTLGQPEGEMLAVQYTADGRFIVGVGADHQLRVWKNTPAGTDHPVVATRYIDPAGLIGMVMIPSPRLPGQETSGPKPTTGDDLLLVISESGSLRLLRCDDWSTAGVLDRVDDTPTDAIVAPDGRSVLVSLMNGQTVRRDVRVTGESLARNELASLPMVYMDLGDPVELAESDLAAQPGFAAGDVMKVPRGAIVRGRVSVSGETDRYGLACRAGEVWAIDADAADGSRLDPIVRILDVSGRLVTRARLQAVKESYFTFRGKNSEQSDDFRLFGWDEMNLNEFLYASGEVTRLFMHPRGPDSGFNVYPGAGQRWTMFGTTPTVHALGEPAYIVRELQPGQPPASNGLPVFDVPYQNDDDPNRVAGQNSRLIFVAPADGDYTIQVGDSRGDGGDGGDQDFGYALTIRAADPSFKVTVAGVNKPLHRGSGREFEVRVQRIDGFEGPVTITASGLPDALHANLPLTIQAGQDRAIGNIWIDADADDQDWTADPEIPLTATATIHGRRVERSPGTLGKLSLQARPKAIPRIEPIDESTAQRDEFGRLILSVRRGQTISARVVVDREDGFTQEISFGKETSGRNTAHGVYIDNIGLNGLLVRHHESAQTFFLTADPVAQTGPRLFHLTAEIQSGLTTSSVIVDVLP